MRKIVIGFLLTVSAVSFASPIDTAYDLLDAISWRDGYALEGIFSADLYLTLTSFLDQARDLIEADPVLAGNLLVGRYGGRITVADFDILTNEEILGRIMGEVRLQSDDQIEMETADMQGRTATVVISYFDGSSISFLMVWEDSNWRISDTSLLATVFR